MDTFNYQSNLRNNPLLKESEKARWAKLAGLPKKETKQQLDENVVGIGAVNQIFPTREPNDYEMAFEHFLGEMYDSKSTPSIEDDADHIDALEKDMGYDAEKIEEGLSEDFLSRIEGLANVRDLKTMHDMLRMLTADWMQEGFEKEDIQDYITDFINKI